MRQVVGTVFLGVTLLLSACQDEQVEPPTTAAPTLAAAAEYLTDEIPACSPIEGLPGVDPCVPDGRLGYDSWETLLASGRPKGDGTVPPTIREYLDQDGRIDRAAHAVVRGTFQSGTVRCIADTLHVGVPYAEADWAGEPASKCFGDFNVRGYILGSGPSKVTLQIYQYPFVMDPIEVYRHGFEELDAPAGKALGWFSAGYSWRMRPGDGLEDGDLFNREMILFLSPSFSISHEAWAVEELWGMERDEDGTVYAVHPDRNSYRNYSPGDKDRYLLFRDQLEIPLETFTAQVATAHQTRLTEYSGRIGPEDNQYRIPGAAMPMFQTDLNLLESHYRAIGAYDDFTPAQPPAPCASGAVKEDPIEGSGEPVYGWITLDCINLLYAKEELRGELNWAAETDIYDWGGLTIGTYTKGDLSLDYITAVNVSDLGLTGTISPAFGRVYGLTELDLRDNNLTGEIPEELATLEGLQTLKLSGNNLSGCIPHRLASVPNTDLPQVGLAYCEPQAD